MATGKINMSIVRQEIARSRVIDAYATKLVQREFNRQKAIMLAEFDEHPVTEEILEGPTADNISGTLSDAKVPGNLYAFLGFKSEEENPIIKLRDLIEEATYADTIPVVSISKETIHYRFQGHIPTREDITRITPLEWADDDHRSWVAIVENGTNSFSYYLYTRFEKGRSKEALQAKITKGPNKGQLILTQTGRFHETDYTTKIIKKFVESVGSTDFNYAFGA